MKDILTDIIAHTDGLGIFDTLGINATKNGVEIQTRDTDNKVTLLAKLKNPIAEFVGDNDEAKFGMPRIRQLAKLLNLDEYKNDVEIDVIVTNGNPTGLHFKNSSGDFENEYRFMAWAIAENLIGGMMNFNEPTYSTEIEPPMAGIAKFKQQIVVNEDENDFVVFTENNDLIFSFGDPAINSGRFVFCKDVGDVLPRPMYYPAAEALRIMTLAGDKVIKFSDQGLMVIVVDSGLATYTYVLPAKFK